jgi:amino acid adenylation domain-containing protein
MTHPPTVPDGHGRTFAANLPDFLSRSPAGATALVCGPESMTFGELTARVLRLAGEIPGVFVGVALERSTELVIALLAIVEAGAAYIPLDPAYPQARLDQMISSSGLQTILTRQGYAGRFAGCTCLPLDQIDLTAPATTPRNPTGTGDDPLYAIFTSGSTGQPKAATVLRRGFANLLDWYANELALSPSDRTLVISSPSFDLTQKNFFAPLATGGRLVLDAEDRYDISRLSALIRDQQITVINCTPSAFYPLADAAASGAYADLASLRHVILGGEPISLPRLRTWLEHPACHADILNTYGPTECTDICAFHRLHRGNLDDFPFVPLGREIDNVGIEIWDDGSAILPDGEIGELCIRGAGVGAGYLHDPARTAERFIHGAYRTGDLARRLPCGTLEFRGRADHQVKVNGFRIALGEIEIALHHHDRVREAVVVARDNRLTAFIQSAAPVESHVLRDFLSATLPSYMIPGEFRFLDHFPLTPNGKVDRLALSQCEQPKPNAPTAGTTLVSRILSLWSEILERTVDDPDANFFDLGGSSIHLAVLHVRLRDMSGRDFPITELFAAPTARAIADFLSPQAASTAVPTAYDRARLQQAGLARFRRPPTR